MPDHISDENRHQGQEVVVEEEAEGDGDGEVEVEVRAWGRRR